jgi:hypothetical protein
MRPEPQRDVIPKRHKHLILARFPFAAARSGTELNCRPVLVGCRQKKATRKGQFEFAEGPPSAIRPGIGEHGKR